MGDGPTAPTASVLAVGRLVLLFRDDGLDAASAQVGAVSAGGVRLVPGHGGGPGARAADGHPDTDLGQDGNELRAVGGLSGGHHDRQRAAPAVGGEMDLAGQAAPGSAEQGVLQTGSASAAGAAPLFPAGVVCVALSVLFPLAAPFWRACSCSRTASSRASMTSGSTCIPAAS